MKNLQESELAFEFPLGTLDERRTSTVLGLVRQFSAAPAMPWRVRLRKRDDSLHDSSSRDEELEPTLRRALAEEDKILFFMRDGLWPGPVEESVAFRFDYHQRQEVVVGVCVVERDLVPFFVEVCEALTPRHGRFVPRYENIIGLQQTILEMALQRDYGLLGRVGSGAPALVLARGLAPLLPRLGFSMPQPNGLPGRLGWLNYWHEEVAAERGFPDSEKDARILPLCRRADSGAWIVQLTEEPLDLERADHIETLTWAYWRFDKIGKRMQPAARKTKARARQADADVASALGLKVFSLRERDENGQWWDSAVEPIRAASADEAMRIHFARMAYSRLPRKGESLGKLRDMYDRVAAEVGMIRGEDIEAVEAMSPSAGG